MEESGLFSMIFVLLKANAQKPNAENATDNVFGLMCTDVLGSRRDRNTRQMWEKAEQATD